VEFVEQYAEDVIPPKELGSGNGKSHHRHQFSPQTLSLSARRPSPSNISVGSEPKRTDLESFQQSAQARTKQEKLSAQSTFTATSTTSTLASTISSVSHTMPDAIADSGNQQSNVAYHDTRAKEYINDPNETIIRPLKIKKSSPLTNPELKSRVQDWRAERRDTNTETTSNELADQFSTFRNMRESEAENDAVVSYARAEVTESESESDSIPEEENIEEGPSPFQPTAGFTGKFPRGWRQRHERNKSPDRFE
jgi:hypothetical protein